MADARSQDPDADLTGPRLGQDELLDRGRVAGRPQDRGPNGGHALLSRRRSTGWAGT